MERDFKGSKLHSALAKLSKFGDFMLANGRFRTSAEFVAWINMLDELMDGALDAFGIKTGVNDGNTGGNGSAETAKSD